MTAPTTDIPRVMVGVTSDLNMVMLSSRVCGFCGTGSHSRCPGGTRSGTKGVRVCPCEETTECGSKRCLRCKNKRADEVGDSWLCLSGTECEGRIQERLAADPQYQAMLQAKEKGKMTETAEKAAKAEKVAKTGTCLVTGATTKGGLFAPGMDARYVSLKVAEVEGSNFTQKAIDAAAKAMKADGVSEKLIAKFHKSVGLAKDRRDKKVAAEKAKADAKVAAKADKGKAAAPATTED